MELIRETRLVAWNLETATSLPVPFSLLSAHREARCATVGLGPVVGAADE